MPTCYCTGRCRQNGVCPVLGYLGGAPPESRAFVTRSGPNPPPAVPGIGGVGRATPSPPSLTEARVRQIAREEAQQILRESLTRSIRRLPERTGHTNPEGGRL